jgi:hypothetical protein
MPTSTWTDVADFANGDQIPADILTDMTDDLDFLRSPPGALYALSTGAANITTSSATMVDLTGFSISFTCQGKPVEIIFTGRATSTTARFDILVDYGLGGGYVSLTSDNDGVGAPGALGFVTIVKRIAPAAATISVKVQWRSTSGTVTFYAAGLGQLWAVERGAA